MSKKYWPKEVSKIKNLLKLKAWHEEIMKDLKVSEYLAKEIIRKGESWLIGEYSPPKILIVDIETAPMEVYTWWLWNQTISIEQIKNDWFMLCWSAKWLLWKTINKWVLTKNELKNRDDKRISKDLWKLMDEADIVVAHNWDAFDIKKMNARFIKHWLWIPSPYQTIDTLKVARKNFRMTSNKLDYLCRFLWVWWKLSTWWFELWKNAVEWDMWALWKMAVYCMNDVNILESLYLKLRPYVKWHPNLNLYWEWERCSNCWSTDIKWKYKYRSMSTVFECWKCQDCWAFIRRSEANKITKVRSAK